jgi:hypothetical protein
MEEAQERPLPRVVRGAGAAPPPKITAPASWLAAHIALGITWGGGLVQGPPEGPIARARQPFRAPH